MGRKLYVGNLPYEVGEADLQTLFAAAGTVVAVRHDGTVLAAGLSPRHPRRSRGSRSTMGNWPAIP